MANAKPFNIPKREVWEAFKKVKANQGAARVDGQTIAEFEIDLSNNLYRLWNRMSSGSYFPLPVRRVDLPKGDGRTRPLGIPTVGDRVAQEVVKRYLEEARENPVTKDWSLCPGPSQSPEVFLALGDVQVLRYETRASAERGPPRFCSRFVVCVGAGGQDPFPVWK